MKVLQPPNRWTSCCAPRQRKHGFAVDEFITRPFDNASLHFDSARAVVLNRHKTRTLVIAHSTRIDRTRSDVFFQRNTLLKNGTHVILQPEVVLPKRGVLTT